MPKAGQNPSVIVASAWYSWLDTNFRFHLGRLPTLNPEPRTKNPLIRPSGDDDPYVSLTELIVRAKSGNATALDALFRRHYPVLKRLAHRRLPDRARREQDTDDVVQITVLRALRGLEGFDARWENAWLAYLRQILFNYLRDEGRRSGRLPEVEALGEEQPAPSQEPLDLIVDAETMAAYQRALTRLPASQREAVIMRVELGLGYARIAKRLGIPSTDAARMMVKRAIVRLASMVNEES